MKKRIKDSLARNIYGSKEREETEFLIKYFIDNSPIEGLHFLNELSQNSIFVENDTLKSSLYSYYGRIYSKLGKPDYASKFFGKANRLSEKIDDPLIIGWNLIELGNLYFGLKLFNKALHYYQKSITLLDSLRKNKSWVVNKYENILTLMNVVSLENTALCFYNLQKPDSSLKLFLTTSEIRKNVLKDTFGIMYNIFRLSEVYNKLNDYQNSLQYSQICTQIKVPAKIDFYLASEFNKFLANCLFERFKSYYKLNKVDSAKFYLKKCFEIFHDKDDKLDFANILGKAAEFFIQEKEYSKALKYAKNSLEIFQRYPEQVQDKLQILELLSNIYQRLGDKKNENLYLRKINELYDSLNLNLYIASIELGELDAKVEEILFELETAKFEKKLKETQLRSQTILTISISAFLIVFVVLTTFLWKINQKRKILNANLEEQKEELVRLNKELSDFNEKIKQINTQLWESQEELIKKNNELTSAKNLLLSMNEELLKANEINNTLLSIIPHDLRNAIGSFRNITEVLANDYQYFSESDKIDLLIKLKDGGKNLYTIMESLLLWTSLQRGTWKVNKDKQNLKDIVDNTLMQLNTEIKQKNIIIENKVDPELVFEFDPLILQTVLRNLVNNSIKYSYEGGKIEIHSELSPNNFVIITVKDYGKGMTKEQLSKIFEFQNDKSTYGTHGEKGIGLGVLNCNKLIEILGGKFWYESEPEKGTSAIFTIPLSG
ncbi:MAG: ATP-binding protein [Ignavibacteria bacterium]|nr:ATP-binding protein [Ignavibacteria bacterium]